MNLRRTCFTTLLAAGLFTGAQGLGAMDVYLANTWEQDVRVGSWGRTASPVRARVHRDDDPETLGVLPAEGLPLVQGGALHFHLTDGQIPLDGHTLRLKVWREGRADRPAYALMQFQVRLGAAEVELVPVRGRFRSATFGSGGATGDGAFFFLDSIDPLPAAAPGLDQVAPEDGDDLLSARSLRIRAAENLTQAWAAVGPQEGAAPAAPAEERKEPAAQAKPRKPSTRCAIL